LEIKSYKELDVYREALKLVMLVHKLTQHFPSEEKYGLQSQLRRASYSVPMNIAEGYGRGTRRDYAHFISISRGSVFELDAALDICEMLGYAPAIADTRLQIERVGMMLSRLRSSLVSPPKIS
jgi:four helix bundle protein